MSDIEETQETESVEAEVNHAAELEAAIAADEAAGAEPVEAAPPDAAAVEREQRIASRREAAQRAERAAAERREDRRALRRAEEIAKAAEVRIREADERDRTWAERQEAIRKGGLSGLEAHGFSLEELARQEIESKDPAAIAARAMAYAEATKKEFADWKAAQKADREAAERKQAREAETKSLVEYVEQSDTAASDMPAAWLVREADEFAEAYLHARGAQPTFQQVLGELDRRAALFQREKEERAQRKRGAALPGDGTADRIGRPRETGPTTRALGAVDASARGTARRPLSPEEEDRAYRKTLQEQLDREGGILR